MTLREARDYAKSKANETGQTTHVVRGPVTVPHLRGEFWPYVGDIQDLRREYELVESIDEGEKA